MFVAWLTVAWLITVVTGFFIWYWPRVKRRVKIRRHRGPFTFNMDLHKILGIGSLVPVTLAHPPIQAQSPEGAGDRRARARPGGGRPHASRGYGYVRDDGVAVTRRRPRPVTGSGGLWHERAAAGKAP